MVRNTVLRSGSGGIGGHESGIDGWLVPHGGTHHTRCASGVHLDEESKHCTLLGIDDRSKTSLGTES